MTRQTMLSAHEKMESHVSARRFRPFSDGPLNTEAVGMYFPRL
ncbi:MAG: hypothetical protein P4L42_16815 [Desulfocapsaceae bacterium]|nr:hypothetical protein [Desulfocapsaceae bacterium]